MAAAAVIFSIVGSPAEERHVRFLIESLRAFGGELRDSPWLVFLPDPDAVPGACEGLAGVDLVPLAVDLAFRRQHFASKVHACAAAEEMCASDDGSSVGSLVWMNSGCLVARPPNLLSLEPPFEAAMRAVHIRNVGSPATEPPDEFWSEIYRTVGIEAPGISVESFVDRETIRPYFNTHLFSVDPSKGLLRRWLSLWKKMIADTAFVVGPCADEDHRVLLHQAILSALVTPLVETGRLSELPPPYSYPLHFHDRVPDDRRPATLDEVVCPVYEGSFRYPDSLNGLSAPEPLASWLREHAPGGSA
jgi:hypothetical protein